MWEIYRLESPTWIFFNFTSAELTLLTIGVSPLLNILVAEVIVVLNEKGL